MKETTGLMHFVVVRAERNAAIRKSSHAYITPVPISESVGISNPQHHESVFVNIKDAIHVRLRESTVAKYGYISASAEPSLHSCVRLSGFEFGSVIFRGLRKDARDSWWNGGHGHIGIGKFLISNQAEPLVGIGFSCRADQDFANIFDVESGSPSEIDRRNIHPHTFALLDADFWHRVTRPHIWPLVNLKLLSVIVDAFSREASLPERNTRVDYDREEGEPFQPNFMSLMSKVYLALGFVCGGVLLTLGFVCLCYFWRRVGLDTAMNQNVVL